MLRRFSSDFVPGMAFSQRKGEYWRGFDETGRNLRSATRREPILRLERRQFWGSGGAPVSLPPPVAVSTRFLRRGRSVVRRVGAWAAGCVATHCRRVGRWRTRSAGRSVGRTAFVRSVGQSIGHSPRWGTADRSNLANGGLVGPPVGRTDGRPDDPHGSARQSLNGVDPLGTAPTRRTHSVRTVPETCRQSAPDRRATRSRRQLR